MDAVITQDPHRPVCNGPETPLLSGEDRKWIRFNVMGFLEWQGRSRGSPAVVPKGMTLLATYGSLVQPKLTLPVAPCPSTLTFSAPDP